MAVPNIGQSQLSVAAEIDGAEEAEEALLKDSEDGEGAPPSKAEISSSLVAGAEAAVVAGVATRTRSSR